MRGGGVAATAAAAQGRPRRRRRARNDSMRYQLVQGCAVCLVPVSGVVCRDCCLRIDQSAPRSMKPESQTKHYC